MKIENIANLISGQVLSRIEAKDDDDIIKNIKLIVPKSIKNGKIHHNELSNINLNSNVDENKLTKAGDIVLKLSQPYDAAYISEKDEGLLVTSFFLIARDIKDNINPKYLVELINSKIYKKQAMNLASVATIPMLTKTKIKEIDFNILSLEEQEKIINISDNIKNKEQIFNEIIKLEKLKLENFLRGDFK